MGRRVADPVLEAREVVRPAMGVLIDSLERLVADLDAEAKRRRREGDDGGPPA